MPYVLHYLLNLNVYSYIIIKYYYSQPPTRDLLLTGGQGKVAAVIVALAIVTITLSTIKYHNYHACMIVHHDSNYRVFLSSCDRGFIDNNCKNYVS